VVKRIDTPAKKAETKSETPKQGTAKPPARPRP
jgi:hypothetical protein